MIDKETLQKIAKLHNLRPWQQEKHTLPRMPNHFVQTTDKMIVILD